MFLERLVGKRGPWLTLGLTYIALSNAWWAYRYIVIYWDLVAHRAPRVPHWPFLFLSVLSGVAVLGVVGLWLLRKWGLYVYLACWLAGLGVSIYLQVPFRTYLFSLANLVVLYAFLWSKRDLLE